MIIRTSDLRKEFDPSRSEVRIKSFAGEFFVVLTPFASEAITIHTTKSQDEARIILDALCDAIDSGAASFDLRTLLDQSE